MAGDERLWIITLGAPQELGVVGDQGGDLAKFDLYHFVTADGEKCIPVFTSRQRLQGYIRANHANPQAHMDMMEGGDPERAQKLAESGFGGALMDVYNIAELAVAVEADVLVRDPRPGEEQEVMGVPK